MSNIFKTVIFMVCMILGCTEGKNINYQHSNEKMSKTSLEVDWSEYGWADEMNHFAKGFADSLNNINFLEKDGMPHFLKEKELGGGLISMVGPEPKLALRTLIFEQVHNKEILNSIIAYPDTLFDLEFFPNWHGYVDTITHFHTSTRELARLRLKELSEE